MTESTGSQPSRRRALQQMGALALGLGAADLAFGAAIVAVRVWPAADYSRVTIESDQALSARQFFTDNPPRLVIDIDALELSPALRDLVGKVRVDDPFIAGVRVRIGFSNALFPPGTPRRRPLEHPPTCWLGPAAAC